MAKERRDAYRVETTGDDSIRAEIAGEHQRIAGDVLDLSLKGGAVSLPTAEDPTFAIGEMVTVHFHTKPSHPVEVQARVETRSELDGARRFGLSFPDPTALRNTLNAGLLRLFNQRRAFRAELSEDSPVETHMQANGSEVTGRLQNVSADGIALQIGLQDEAKFSTVTEVTVSFELPGSKGPLSFNAIIRNRFRSDDGQHVGYGLQLDPSGSANFPAQQQRIVDYVMQRQRELLQSRVER